MGKDYEYAKLPKDKLDEINRYEQKMSAELGEDIVLIAYEECETKKGAH